MAQTKHIFVTGGVASSLGKGTIAASLGKLLQSRGYRVTNQKLDPYINVDPGTLNPYEHGECFVTVDGHQADLDLGHYERFLDVETHKSNNITTGRIYRHVIEKERQGAYHGKTVQVIPHITDEIKSVILSMDDTCDFVITEIGGTVGDIESLPYIEAVRQLRWELGRNCCVVHLTYVPYLAAAHELKTKPTQHSVKDLQHEGVQPDVIVLRTEHDIPGDIRRKVAQFCNVDEDAVIPAKDAPSIYRVPVNMLSVGLDRVVLRKVGLDPDTLPQPNMHDWNQSLERLENARQEIKIALIGKYVQLQDAYKSIRESLHIAAASLDRKLVLKTIPARDITNENAAAVLSDFRGLLIAPSLEQPKPDGHLAAIRYAREHNIPCFGIGSGMQYMVTEFALNVAGISDISHLMQDGVMRLGSFPSLIEKGSSIESVYSNYRFSQLTSDNQLIIRERHHHYRELNPQYEHRLNAEGLKCVGKNPENGLVDIILLPHHSWFVGVQFHPEYAGTFLHPHPLFVDFIRVTL